MDSLHLQQEGRAGELLDLVSILIQRKGGCSGRLRSLLIMVCIFLLASVIEDSCIGQLLRCGIVQRQVESGFWQHSHSGVG